MAFRKGISGNPKGRKVGSPNKVGNGLREMIAEFLDGEFENIKADFKKLEPKDRMKFYADLLQYGLPKLQAVSSTINFENMSDEQLD
jgi:hypothetical protein